MKTRTAPIPVAPALGVDLLIFLVAAIAAFVFSQAVSLALASASINQTLEAPPQVLVVVSSVIIPIFFMAMDGINAAGNRLKLPLAGSRKRAQQIYARRIHLGLLALYFNAILVALCWSASAMPVMSKIYLAAVFAIAIYALGQSIPSTKLSFTLSGILFVIVLLATQTFIITKTQSEAEQAGQELRQRLGGGEVPEGEAQ
ncbi:hypothetical protein N836_22765 [Leptolyngbya sp. Heron Island J]|uniref:hypothetical protein n=1 Tax=Leptolyngbya sp. Heron Island J TaxID=1385935 RepID=UPI0003B9711D|nr:hypothetical protein [Leptolyngbya sp. Heron Island J]ESA33217.1 hypothetical protein N836_22765 [Leptolyngbya sp. Heron Island J]